MKKYALILLLMFVALAMTSCQEQQQSSQHPTTVKQMESIEKWSQGTMNNLMYIYKQALDPNNPDSLASRVEALEKVNSLSWWQRRKGK